MTDNFSDPIAALREYRNNSAHRRSAPGTRVSLLLSAFHTIRIIVRRL